MRKVAIIDAHFPSLENGLPVNHLTLYLDDDGDHWIMVGNNTGHIDVPYHDLTGFLQQHISLEDVTSVEPLRLGIPVRHWKILNPADMPSR